MAGNEIEKSGEEGQKRRDSGMPPETIFDDPSIQQTIAEDPLFTFLQKWWRQIAVVVLAVALGYYFRESFQENYERSMRRSADTFSKVRAEYEQVLNLHQQLPDNIEEDSEAAKTFTEAKERLMLTIASLGDAREPYQTLSGLYRALVALEIEGDTEATSRLQTLAAEIKQKGDESLVPFADLALFAAARSGLDDADSRSAAIGQLTELAKSSAVVDVAAGVTLARVADTPEQRAEARQILEEILRRSPEQADIVEPVVNSL